MLRRMLRAKIHRCVVTGAEIDYVGSVTLDPDLADAAGLATGEFVHVWNIASGARFETYVILGERGSGTVCVNGAAARLVEVGDLLILAAEGLASDQEAAAGVPARVVLVDQRNRVVRVTEGETHGPAD